MTKSGGTGPARALVGLLVIACLSGVDVGGQRAAGSAVMAQGACLAPPRDPEFFVASPAASPTPTSSSLVELFEASSEAAPHAEMMALQSVLVHLVACLNAGDFARSAALFTDSFWAREIGGMPWKAAALSDQARATPQALPVNQQTPQPVIVGVRVLADGRRGALVRFGAPTPSDSHLDLVAFRQVDGQWLIDEVVTDYRGDDATPTAE